MAQLGSWDYGLTNQIGHGKCFRCGVCKPDKKSGLCSSCQEKDERAKFFHQFRYKKEIS